MRSNSPVPDQLATPHGRRRRQLLGALAGAPVWLAAGCGGGGAGEPAPDRVAAIPPDPGDAATRSWAMGFGGDPPRPDLQTLLTGIEHWSRRAEFAVMHQDMPWAELLAGASAQALVLRDKLPLVQHYRSKGLQVVFMVDPNDGLSRGEDAAVLRQAGRSMTEVAVQRLYRDYVLAAARVLQPDQLGLVPETNLIRAAAPAALYGGIRSAAVAASQDVRNAGLGTALLVSVQVETAWGLLVGQGSYRGIAQDLADFAFTQRLGLSSYPYLAFDHPDQLPADYYGRVVAGSGLRPLVVEGGWTSKSDAGLRSSPDLQARYIARHAALLDSVSALGVSQLIFADPDLAALPQPLPANLPLFAGVGLTDSQFNAKPALQAWDAQFAKALKAV